jgi:hypothetical protein
MASFILPDHLQRSTPYRLFLFLLIKIIYERHYYESAYVFGYLIFDSELKLKYFSTLNKDYPKIIHIIVTLSSCLFELGKH